MVGTMRSLAPNLHECVKNDFTELLKTTPKSTDALEVEQSLPEARSTFVCLVQSKINIECIVSTGPKLSM